MGKLLVVDDDRTLRASIFHTLSAKGYQVIEAKDGFEALLAFQLFRGEISMVIMDVMMPRMDGIATTTMIKSAEPSMKVVLMGGEMPEVLLEGRADGYLCKPFRRKDLIHVVENNIQAGAVF